MQLTSTIIAGTIVATPLAVVLSALLPEPQPIQVHALQFDGGQIVQSRTVTFAGDVFFARWEAQVEDATSGEIICQGSGTWNYKVGYLDARMPLARWVGQTDCTYESLPEGDYVPVASWYWGSDQTSFRGDTFTKKEN